MRAERRIRRHSLSNAAVQMSRRPPSAVGNILAWLSWKTETLHKNKHAHCTRGVLLFAAIIAGWNCLGTSIYL